MLIVLEGLDGAGKSTQIQLLRQYLEKQGMKSEYLHFPRFDAPVYGELIARFLRGEFGSVEQVNPYLVALLYAGDRNDAAKLIRGWLAEGKAVVLDRYVYSNIGYQCAKLHTREERDRLAEWILELEYHHYAIPRPDLSLFLDVPFAFTERKLSEQREGDDRNYLQGGRDIHEGSLDLQQCVREVYLTAADHDEALRVVSCDDGSGSMASPEEIFSRIEKIVTPLIKHQ
ncbi:MAG: dTMP kinase [Rikenellaceae bacterium]|nr:dTMP kinase [Rikenellaceae bacterium]